VRYQPNVAVLHTDTNLLPRRQRVWSAWNYLGSRSIDGMHPVCVSYLVNQLQPLPFRTPLVVTLNPVTQPAPGTHDAQSLDECKARIAAIAQRRGAVMIDWDFASSLTRNDLNYWDALHYRVPIATQLVKELAGAALSGQEATDGTYRIVVR